MRPPFRTDAHPIGGSTHALRRDDLEAQTRQHAPTLLSNAAPRDARRHRPEQARCDWETPPGVFAAINAEFDFDLDVCATVATAKCPRFYTPADNGLAQPWAPHRSWCNPPYGPGIERWVRKAHEESQNGALVVCLVPPCIDTAWWHDWAMQAAEIRFVRRRIAFLHGKVAGKANNSGSCLLVFRPGWSGGTPVCRSWTWKTPGRELLRLRHEPREVARGPPSHQLW